ELQRAGDNIGSVEDVELLERIWQTGRECLYTPRLVVTAEVPEERMTKDYHRRWHTGHGHFFAIMRSEEMEQSFSRLFDVPAHLYRQVVADAAAWLKYSLAGKRERAFAHETGIRFFSGFFRKRRQDFLNATEGSASREIARFIRSLISKKSYRNISKEIG
ncbi:MAG TPA: hypothetical protein VID27_07150, partial [Blastocatellia bacterium]